MPAEILLQAERLSRRYGERVALAGLDLSLARGELLGLLGPNGAGKSTTLRMLSGTLPPSDGRVVVCGHDLFEQPLAAKRRLGYLPELPPVYPDMRVADYLRYCGRLHGLRGSALAQAVAAAAQRCGLGEVARRVIGNLSKGYQQRLGIAQAILHRPDVVILDEPTVGLDPLQIRAVRELIGELKRDHAVILSSHILPEIQALADRVVILHRGRAVYSGALGGVPADGTEVLLACRRPPEVAVLARLQGMVTAQALGGGRFRLRLADQAAAERAQRAALDGGWGLEEWRPMGDGLEGLFVALTSGEAA